MKKIFIIILLFTGSFAFAQEGVSVSGNKITSREIAPVWTGCEDTGSEKEKKECFNKKLVEHMKQHYKFPKDAEGNYIRGKTVVSFNINEKGEVDILSVEGPKQPLNKEAERIISLIPKMQPGERAGKPIAVKYKVPFTF